jgi:hypothetical protein
VSDSHASVGPATPAASGPRITVTFTTTFAEQVAVAQSVYRSSKAWWTSMALFAGLPLALAVRQGAHTGLGVDVAMMGLAAAGSLVFWNRGISWIGVRAARRGARNPDGPFTWAIDGEGCRLEGPSGVATMRWDAVVETRETPETFLLFVSQTTAHFIPKRAVADADLPILRQLLERRPR